MGREILLDDHDDRLGGLAGRPQHLPEGGALGHRGIRQAVGAGHRKAAGPAQLGEHGPHPLVGVPVGIPWVVQTQAGVRPGIGGHHVGDGGGVKLLELLDDAQLLFHGDHEARPPF